MDMPTEFRLALQDKAPPAALRLFDQIVSHAISHPGNPLELSANKGAVLAALKSDHGDNPDDAALRQRLRSITKLFRGEASLQIDGQPMLEIRSTKYAYVLCWTEGAREKLGLAKTREVVVKAGHSDYASNVGNIKPIENSLEVPRHRVLVSHNWESEEINAVLDRFVDDLQTMLKKLPAKYAGKYAIELLYDRSGGMHVRGTFTEQMEDLCNRSSMAIFVTSNGWCHSKACQIEAEHFQRRCGEGRQRPYIQVQLCDSGRELPETCREQPTLPEFWPQFSPAQNLLDMEDFSLARRSQFVAKVRDEICEFLDQLPGPPDGKIDRSRPQTQHDLKRALLRHTVKMDVDAARRITGEFTPDDGDDQQHSNKARLPAVDTLHTWVTDPEAESRLVVLLGGFGMGKTTTVQSLQERLRGDLEAGRDVPTPIYLDFRRLAPLTEPGKPVTATLAELVVQSLHSDARTSVSGEDVINLVRSEPCLVIFDGLDEVGNKIGRDYAAQLFRQFLELIPGDVQAKEAKSGKADWAQCPTRLILTCRTHFFRTLREQNALLAGSHRRAVNLRVEEKSTKVACVDTYYMAPLSIDQIGQLFERHLGEELGRATLDLIRPIHDLPGLASRPIMARFISEVAGQLVDIHRAGRPINIATIYEELFLETLAGDAEKRPLLTPADRRDVLTALATHLHGSGQNAMTADDLERWFDGFANRHDGLRLTLSTTTITARGLLHTELENASLLIRSADDKFSFAHTSYFEYFLALALAAADSPDALTPLCDRPISAETRVFLQAITERDQIEPIHTARWAALLRSDALMPVRRFAYDMLKQGGSDPLISGANVSGFDLKRLKLPPRAQISGVNFGGAALNRLDARGVRFQDCNFERTILGNATLEDCQFERITGEPVSLASARGVRTSLPDPWQRIDTATAALSANETDYREWFVPRMDVMRSAAFNPDGSLIVTASDDGAARIWDAASGALVRTLEGHTDLILSTAFSPDGNHIVTASQDQTVRLWDAGSSILTRTLEGHTDLVWSAAFSPDGNHIVTASGDRTARFWDAASGTLIRTLDGHGDGVAGAAFSPDGRQIVTASFDKTARLWDAASGTLIRTLEGHAGWVMSMAFSPDGNLIVTASQDQTARLWDAASGTLIRTLEGHGDGVAGAAFSPDGRHIVTASKDQTARLWDAASGTLIRTLEGHGDGVMSAAFSPDGRYIVTACLDNTAPLWDAASGTLIHTLAGPEFSLWSATFSPDGRLIVTASSDKTARIWNAASGTLIRTLEGHADDIVNAAFSPDGSLIVTASKDKTARIWDAASGTLVRTLEGHVDWVWSTTLSPGGRQIVTASADKTARLWDAAGGTLIRTLEGHADQIVNATFNPEGSLIVTASTDKTARIWDATSGTLVCTLEGHGDKVINAVFSPDGNQIVTASHDKTARLWDAASGTMIRTLKGHERGVESAAFSPDGRYIVTASHDRTARIWDAVNGILIRTLEGHVGVLMSAAFSPDGSQIVTSGDSVARLWDAQNGQCTLTILSLPESWATLDTHDRILTHGPNMWRYASCPPHAPSTA